MGKAVIAEDTAIARQIDLVAADMDGETVMINIESGKYFGLDSIGSRIWELIAAPQRVSAVVDRLTEEYVVEREQCLADILIFLNRLYSEGLIRVA